MVSVANSLQKVVYELLAGDAELVSLVGSDGIFDHRSSGRPMPYVVIADIVTSDAGPAMQEHVLTLEAWSDKSGRHEVQTIAGRVAELFAEGDLVPEDLVLVNLHHLKTRVRREIRSKALVAEMTFRAVTE